MVNPVRSSLMIVMLYWVQMTQPQTAGTPEVLRIPEASKTISSRKGCNEVLTCTGVGTVPPIWRKKVRGGKDGVISREIKNSSTTIDNRKFIWESSVLFKSLNEEDFGVYTCSFGDLTRTMVLHVNPNVTQFSPIENIDLSEYNAGDVLPLCCEVDTCIPDIVVQLFKDDQLLVLSTVLEGSLYLACVNLKVSEDLVGQYACQAMSEETNLFDREYFSINGVPQRPLA